MIQSNKKISWYKSETVLTSIAISSFGVIEQSLPLLRESLGNYYGYVFMAIGIIGVVLRKSSTMPIGK